VQALPAARGARGAAGRARAANRLVKVSSEGARPRARRPRYSAAASSSSPATECAYSSAL